MRNGKLRNTNDENKCIVNLNLRRRRETTNYV
jgi:hypothetical protein